MTRGLKAMQAICANKVQEAHIGRWRATPIIDVRSMRQNTSIIVIRDHEVLCHLFRTPLLPSLWTNQGTDRLRESRGDPAVVAPGETGKSRASAYISRMLQVRDAQLREDGFHHALNMAFKILLDWLPIREARSEERRVGRESVSTCRTRW